MKVGKQMRLLESLIYSFLVFFIISINGDFRLLILPVLNFIALLIIVLATEKRLTYNLRKGKKNMQTTKNCFGCAFYLPDKDNISPKTLGYCLYRAEQLKGEPTSICGLSITPSSVKKNSFCKDCVNLKKSLSKNTCVIHNKTMGEAHKNFCTCKLFIADLSNVVQVYNHKVT